MKTYIKKIVSLLLVVAILCSLIPTIPAYASTDAGSDASTDIDPYGKLANLTHGSYILASIEDYYEKYSNLKLKENITVFFFEGGSNSGTDYTIGGDRDPAIAIVTKDGEITYVEDQCSTIPDVPYKEYAKSKPSAANVLDGIYRFVGYEHNGEYEAFQIRTLNNGGNLPCIRFTQSDSIYDYYYNATGINIHGRTSMVSGSENSKKPWSSGCVLVGCDMGDYEAFRDHIIRKAAVNEEEAQWEAEKDYGFVVIDRKLAKDDLESSELYSGYTGAVDALLGNSSILRIYLDEIGTIQHKETHNIIGEITSSSIITKVIGSIYSTSNLNDPIQQHLITPNSTNVNLKDSGINTALKFGSLDCGEYILRIDAVNSNGIEVSESITFTVQGESTLKLDVKSIGTILQGSEHNIIGTISSNYNITHVVGEILSGSTEKQSWSIFPHMTSVYLESSELNTNLKFASLAPGSYTLRIKATDASTACKITNIDFQIDPAIVIVSVDSIDPIQKGSDIDIIGKIVSNYNIVSVTAEIYSGSTVIQRHTILPDTTNSIALKDSRINERLDFGLLTTGSYVLELTAKDANGGIGKDKVEFNVKSRISIILEKVFSIIKGDSHEISGEITSKSKITTVIAKIFSGDREIAKKEIRTKETRVVLRNSMINACIKSDALFSDLPVGSYTLEITAINEDGETESARVDFTVVDPEPSTEAADTLSIGVDPIGTVNKGSVHNITGQITSDYSITEVVGRILSGSKVMQSYTIYPGTTMVNLKSSAINTNLKFGSLPSGSYALQITATDASGTSKTADIPFTIKAAASTLSISVDDFDTVLLGDIHNISGKIISNYKITRVVGEILSGSTVKQSHTINPNTTSVDLIHSGINAYLKFADLVAGTYILRITATDASGMSKSSERLFTVKSNSTLAIALDAIGTITQGSTHDITGTVTSNYKITEVVGEILSGSTVKQSHTINPNTTGVDLQSSGINAYLRFADLAAGSYKLRITATDASGECKVANVSFAIETIPSTLSVSVDAIGTITQGKTHNITGKVTSNYVITKVIGEILSGSTVKQSHTIYPNTKSVDLQSSDLNAYLTFGSLTAGNYMLRITATDESGERKVANVSFTIETIPSTLSVSVDAIGTITQGKTHNITGKVTSNYVITKVIGEILSGSTVKQSHTIYPNTKSVDLQSSDLNAYLTFGSLTAGNYMLRITATDESGERKVANVSFAIETIPSTLSVSVDAIGTITQGSTHDITGMVTSNYKITEVVGKILSGSTVKQSHTINPNTTGVDLKSSGINTYLRFADLAAGSYKLRITATDASGMSKSTERAFTVSANSTLAIALDAIGTITQGSTHNITGTVTSNYKITEVVGKILSGSTVKQSHTINPNTTSVDLKSSGINTYLKFANLAAGSYKLLITATDASGMSKSTERAFTVSANSTLTVTVGTIGTITQGSTHNITGKVTSNCKITSVTGKILSGSTTKQTYTIYPNTTSVDLQSSAINMNLRFGILTAGSYTLRIMATDANGGSNTTNVSFTVKNSADISITINSIGTIIKGSSHNITGSVTSGYKITNVTGKILSGTELVQSYVIRPYTTSVDLKSSAINMNLKFGTLAVGTYVLQITATDESGKTVTKKVSFTVVNYKGQFGVALPIFPIGNRPSIPDIGVIRADWESLLLGGTKS